MTIPLLSLNLLHSNLQTSNPIPLLPPVTYSEMENA